MTVAGAVAEVVAALEAAGLRVAVRAGDLTPPCVLIRIGAVTDAGTTLAGGTASTLWVYYVPIRGVDNLTGDADALDRIYAALVPITVTELQATASAVTVGQESYNCYRLDVTTLGDNTE